MAECITVFYSSGFNGGSGNVLMISDDSGYYIFGFASAYMSIWKYLFSTPSSAQCQQILSFASNALGQVKITDSSLFAITMDSSFSFHFFRITFANTSSDWSSVMPCPVGATWSFGNPGSALASSKIYIFFPTSGSNANPIYAAALSVANGAVVSSRFKTSANWASIEGIAATGSYIAATIFNGFYHLGLWNIATDQIIVKSFNGNALGGWSVDSMGR